MDALRDITDELITALAPLIDAAREPQKLQALLADLGWTPNSVPQPLRDLALVGEELIELIGTGGESFDSAQAIDSVKRLTEAINAIANNPDNAFPSGVDIATFKATIARDLLDYLLVAHLLRNHNRIGAVLKLAGLIRLIDTPATGTRQTYLRHEVEWNRIGMLLTDPIKGFRDAFAWESAAPRVEAAVADVAGLLESYGLRLTAFEPSPALLAFVNAGATVPVVDPLGIDLAFDELLGAPAGIEVGFQLLVMPATAVRGLGISLLPYARLNGATEISLSDALSLTIGGSADFSGGIAINLAVGQPPEVKADVLAGVFTNPPEIALGLKLKPPPDVPERTLLGAPDASRFAIKKLGFAIGARLVSPKKIDAFVEVQLDGAHIVVKPAPDEADSFLGSLLGAEGISAELSVGIRLSSLSGFSFTGSGGLEASFPSHITLGPIEVQGLTLGLKPRGQDVDVEVSASVSGTLGPLAFAVERAGFKLIAQFPDPPRGNLGPLNLAIGFKPPNGVGLAIDAGAVKGGGYLYFDFDKEEYAGVLQLMIAGFLTVTAIGLVTTRMPDGSKGFSLLIIITAEFGTGIQIGMGFTLLGVGGLLGLNRTVLLQPLADGVRNGAVNNIMFPKDVVANAPRIISDLRAIFPPFEGKFLIGPLAKLGWGSPPLITLSLGVVIEIPGNLAILGVLRCILPDDKAPVLVLQVAFMGAIEFDKKRLWLFAAIFDSKVLTFVLEGEMGVLFGWGDDANFVLSVGGFHPRFKPPPLPFPTPKRLSLAILDDANARIRVSCYFAITTNTVQFGASAELYFGFSAISIEGNFHFDALFQFSPFYFIIELGASFSLKVSGMGLFSVSVDMALEGPTPWHAHGSGSISFFFFSVSADFDVTWGEEKDTTLPPVEVFPILAAELEKEPNWTALPPRTANLLVALRVVNDKKEFVLHPVGALRITQRAVPLNSKIDLFGSQQPADANRFTLASKTTGLAVAKAARESFAPAQFHKMSRNEKLAAPAFADEDRGVDLSASGDNLRSSLVVRRIVRYEQIIIDTNFKRFAQSYTAFPEGLFKHFLLGNAAARSALSAKLKKQMQPYDDAIETASEGYAVVSTETNTIVAGTTVFGSYHAAKEHMEASIQRKPGLAGTMQVVPEFEVNLAA